MTEEFAADYEQMCSPYPFRVTWGSRGKGLSASSPLTADSVVLVESPMVAWPVQSSVAFSSFSFCENCLKVRPFSHEGGMNQGLSKFHATEYYRAVHTSAARVQGTSLEKPPTPSQPPLLELEVDTTGITVNVSKDSSLWFCTRRCYDQAFGVALQREEAQKAAEGSGDLELNPPPLSRKRDARRNIRESHSIVTDHAVESRAQYAADGSVRMYGWMEFLNPSQLTELRQMDMLHYCQRQNGQGCSSAQDPQQNKEATSIGMEALGRVCARVAATAATFVASRGLSVADAYAEGCRPFARLAGASLEEVLSVFDVNLASSYLRTVLGPSIVDVLGEDAAEALLRMEALAFLFGNLMRNAQGLLIWGAAEDGSLMLLRAAGVFILQACCNHSCNPNCCIENETDATIQLKTIRNISEGEELTIAYVRVDLPTEERKRLLKEGYDFVCECEVCNQ